VNSDFDSIVIIAVLMHQVPDHCHDSSNIAHGWEISVVLFTSFIDNIYMMAPFPSRTAGATTTVFCSLYCAIRPAYRPNGSGKATKRSSPVNSSIEHVAKCGCDYALLPAVEDPPPSSPGGPPAIAVALALAVQFTCEQSEWIWEILQVLTRTLHRVAFCSHTQHISEIVVR
jgi:hypothetical protein